MVSYNKEKKSTAKKLACKRRKMGYNATIYKKDKGYGVSVTTKK